VEEVDLAIYVFW